MNVSKKLTAFGGATYAEVGEVEEEAPLGNQTVSQFLLAALGPQQMDDFSLLVLVTLFYTLLFLTGVAGNLSVCLVIVRSRGLHSAMNYYLVSLAGADLTIILLGLPNELSIFWHQYPDLFGDVFCRLRSFLSESASYASVLTIVAFSLERYLAICRPLYVFPLSDLRRASIVSSLCWAVAMVASVPHLLFTKINYIPFPFPDGPPAPQSAFCAMLHIPQWYPVHEISFLVFFLLPVLLLTFLYISMVRAIRQAAQTNLRKSVYRGSEGQARDNNTQIIRMLVSVVVLFFISWAPFHFQRLGYVYFREHVYFRTVNQYLFYLSGFFYFLSSTLNPILYNVMSAKYRAAFLSWVLCRDPNSPRREDRRGCLTTCATSTSNLLTSSYVGLHLKGLVDSGWGSSRKEAASRPRSSSLQHPSSHLLDPNYRKSSNSEEGGREGLTAGGEGGGRNPPPRGRASNEEGGRGGLLQLPNPTIRVVGPGLEEERQEGWSHL